MSAKSQYLGGVGDKKPNPVFKSFATITGTLRRDAARAP
jgi:hypothetical protein